MDSVDKILDALDEECFGGNAVNGEVAIPAAEEVLGDALTNEAIVNANERAIMRQAGGAEFDCRKSGGGHRTIHFWRKGAGEDAVYIPVLEPRGRRGVECAQLNESRPWPGLGHVAADAGEHLAGVGAGRFNQKGDPGDVPGVERHDDGKPDIW